MVALNEIQERSRRIAEHFRPDKIILFGSCATAPRAVPTSEVLEAPNDVDLLVIMPFEGKGFHKSLEILNHLDPRFSVDVVVRRPDDASRRYAEFDPLIRDAFDSGIVLYERNGWRVG